MDYLTGLLSDPTAWVALATLIAMEVILGIDNLLFISILTNKLPPEHRQRARRIGIGLALIMRLVLLSMIFVIVQLTQPVLTLFGHTFSWRDIILIAGGLFLLWKATKEIHHNIDPKAGPEDQVFDTSKATLGVSAAIIFSRRPPFSCLPARNIRAPPPSVTSTAARSTADPELA